MMDITNCGQIPASALAQLLRPYGIQLEWVKQDQPIPGSHFGEPEAGLIAEQLYVREDTPIHSLLHEACHYICMDDVRRHHLHTDAGGDYDEENAVCYLSILLADTLPGYNAAKMMNDMDSWGYTFRLGSARRWFEEDADDARNWLQLSGIINNDEMPTGIVRTDR